MKRRLLVHPDELSKKWIDRMKTAGVDVLGIHPVGGENAHKSLEDLLHRLEQEEFRALLDYAAEAGLSIEYELHAGSYLLPRELFDTHPEFFRVGADGTRTPNCNFCVSSQEAMDYVAARAAELAGKLYRSTGDYYFWMDDSHDSDCRCPACKDFSASDQQLMVMNHIVKKLRETNPNARLAYLAYFECIVPPQTVRPEPGIFLEYAPIERDMKKPVAAMPPEKTENIRKLLEFFGSRGARVLEYWYDNSLFSNWTKPPVRFVPNNAIIQEDLRFYTELGFEEIGSFACYLGPDYEALYGEPDISAFIAISE